MKSRGIALVSVLLCLVMTLVLTATLFFIWFVDAQATSNGSAGDDALHVAEAGIHHLWSILEPGPDFAGELAWPAGEPPFGAVVWFPEPPRTYRVRVSPAPGGALSVVSQGTSRRGTRRSVEAVFRRDPFRPPATMIFAPSTTLSDTSGSLDPSNAGSDPEVPAIGSEAAAEAEALQRAGGAFAAAATVGPSGLARALGPLRDAAVRTYDLAQSGGTWGTVASPQITRLISDAELSGTISAGGIVIADAPLRIRGRFDVYGLLLAPVGIEVTGELVIHGAVWLGTELRLAESGTVALDDSSAGLAAAATAGGNALPRPAVLGAWKEAW